MIPDRFIEFYYGKSKRVDLHNLTKEDAKISLIYAVENADLDIKCLVVIHGYHSGQVIKNFVRNEFSHKRVAEKVVLDAGQTLFLLKN